MGYDGIFSFSHTSSVIEGQKDYGIACFRRWHGWQLKEKALLTLNFLHIPQQHPRFLRPRHKCKNVTKCLKHIQLSESVTLYQIDRWHYLE